MGIKKYIGEVMIIIGSGLSSYNVFNFSYKIYSPLGSEFEGVVYYYSSNSLILISIGIMLIISGIFIIKQKND